MIRANAADDLAAKYWELTNTQVDAEKGLGSALIENNKLLLLIVLKTLNLLKIS